MSGSDLSVPGTALTLVITTFNRAGYLRGLLDSVAALDPAPERIIVVDNASTDDTQAIISAAASRLPMPVVNLRLPVNAGGAGGFSAGVERALAEGASWLWVMDDDVVVLPGAVAALIKWTGTYQCIHGRRLDDAGSPFFWQHRFLPFLGIHVPIRGNVFRDTPVFSTNVGCFEGMLISADLVRRIGLPDARYFINGDDEIYGWLASRLTDVVYVNDFVLQKVRPQKQIDLGIRHLNDSSDLSRFYSMRNRGHTAQYLLAHGRYSRAGFALGTLLTAGKEVLRLLAVEHRISGVGSLWRGWRESRAIMHDESWQPLPPLEDLPHHDRKHQV
ncbi:glycosyltransferase [Arthrobacter sp. zg-Y820]|uniref:glycosyltransferase n=1 Tax=unclassified Arthrobacter TaxID=235627 RepID=UPI001E28E114|nr:MULTISPECIES: glycosyltransferase [unclassified Arthrobacter]MCC9196088.1 glycosyltransferase [Arthrobacter sp. zg-Y820]MDK1278947.1 glycosyltransferase [Arthrobacter sp. zg.Y820]WIB08640.1 glycosyltransferase [Arthrobacter sp. zg-Y820]